MKKASIHSGFPEKHVLILTTIPTAKEREADSGLKVYAVLAIKKTITKTNK